MGVLKIKTESGYIPAGAFGPPGTAGFDGMDSYAGWDAVTSTVPHTWASTDVVRINGIYMAS